VYEQIAWDTPVWPLAIVLTTATDGGVGYLNV
jgi:hypothetical protein